MPLIPLPPMTVKLIGSSQVITSVSSVIKELMENSIDSGAQHIEVKLDKHGLEKIEVKDDGSGITKEDLTVICLPYYTSKILEFSDLDSLSSYGFRGEALSSLCNVAQVSVTSKTADDDVASCYSYDNNGKVICSKISHISKGTTVTVTELFKNLPVRKQFVSSSKRAAEELKRVEKLVKSLAMVHPRLRVTLIHNKFLIWQKTRVSNLRQSVMQVISVNIVKQLHQILHSSDQIRVEMLVPKRDSDVSSLCFSNLTDAYFLFINNRPVQSKEVKKAVYNKLFEFFGVYVPANKYPVCVTCLTLPPDCLDVNLEPNKTRVYLKNQDEVLDFITQCLHIYYGEGKREEENQNSTKGNKKRKVDEEDLVVTKKVNLDPDNSCLAEVDCSPVKQAIKFPNMDNMTLSQSTSDSGNCLNELTSTQDSTSSSKSIDCIFEQFCLDRVKETTHGPSNKSDKTCLVSNHVIPELKCEKLMQEIDSQSTVNEPVVSKHFNNFSNTISVSSYTKQKLRDNNQNLGSKNIRSTSKMMDDCLENTNKVFTTAVNLNTMDSYVEKLINMDAYEEISNTMDAYASNNSTSIIVEDDAENFEPKSQEQKEEDSISVELSRDLSTPTLSQWSKGVMVNSEGEKIQGHCLLRRMAEPESPNLSQELTNRSVSSQMGCKEMSAFTKFARKMRKKILEDKPDLSFTKVAQMLQAQWRNLNVDERKKYEEGLKIVKSPSSVHSSKQKTNSDFINSDPGLELDITMEKIQRMVKEQVIQADETDISLVGRLEASPLWLYHMHDSGVFAFSISRLQEAVIFHRYLAEFSVPSKQLNDNVTITSSDLSLEEWGLLLQLERSPNGIITDERLTRNGLIVEISQGDVEARLSYVPKNVAFCGVEEVREVLSLLLTHGTSASLAQCRPLRITSFIRSEVMRECSKEEPPSQPEQVSELLSYWLNCVYPQSKHCIHYRPITQCLLSS